MTDVEKICDDFYRDGIAVCDRFVSEAEVDLFLGEMLGGNAALKKAGVGTGSGLRVDAGVRGDFIRWLDPDREALFRQYYFSKLEPVMASFNRRFFLGIASAEHHLAYYPAGTHYERHVDTFRQTDTRVVSTVLYLNKGWKPGHGGELCIYPQEQPARRIDPIAGRLALFESTLPHEVLACQAPRYSITGWFRRNAAF